MPIRAEQTASRLRHNVHWIWLAATMLVILTSIATYSWMHPLDLSLAHHRVAIGRRVRVIPGDTYLLWTSAGLSWLANPHTPRVRRYTPYDNDCYVVAWQ